MRPLLGGLGLAGAALVAAALAVARVEPPGWQSLAVSTLVTDRAGRPLGLYTTPGGYYRLPADPGEVDPRFLGHLVALEDRRFRRHAGVDPLAAARAAAQNLRRGEVVSGASTLTMQVVRLLDPRPRTLSAKLREAAAALNLERRHGKGAILGAYLTLAPYGGNIQGVRAASLLYFGKPPARLTLAESALLAALPQAPEARRPDRHPDAARRARGAVLGRLVQAGRVSPAAAARANAAPLPEGRRGAPRLAPHLGDRLREEHPGKPVLATTLDRGLQEAVARLVGTHGATLPGGSSVAVVVAENATGAVRAYVGGAGYGHRVPGGFLDLARAVRSPGSALKPFAYGLAFHGGLAHPASRTWDGPLERADYRPGNLDGRHRGAVTLGDALAASLNVPAVRVVEAVGPGRLARWLERSGLAIHLPRADVAPGLPLVLGGAGVTLADLTALYGVFPREGLARPLRYLAGEPGAPPRRVLSREAARQVTAALARAPRPAGRSGARPLAFKTGTSYGYRDAWAVGFDGGHTVGVWAGRPDGGAGTGRTGLQAAAPLLFQVFDLLPEVPLAGDPAGEGPGEGPPPALAWLGPRPAPRISFPVAGSTVLADPDDGVVLEAAGGRPPLRWLVNGAPLPTGGGGHQALWRPQRAGPARITLVAGPGARDTVRVRVRFPGEGG